MTKIICPLIYNHFSLSSSGERTLCCMSYYGLANEHDKVAYDFSYEQDRKKALDAFEIGKFPASCRGCEVAEQHGKKSYRQIVLEEFPETTKLIENNQVENIEIEYLDLKLGNKCNMACRMCNPQSSSLLEKENETSVMFLKNPKELNFDWPTKEKYWADINKQTAHLKKINLAGGEPFINKEGIGFLKSLVDSGKSKSIDLFINSNGSIYSEDLVKVLLSFKRVTIYFSVDGTKDTFEIIRFPMKWDFILKNLKKWASVACLNRNFEISLNPTVQIYNLFEIEELLTLVESLDGVSNELKFNLLEYPHCFNIKNLPQRGKAQAKLYLIDLISKYPKNAVEIKAIVSHLMQEEDEGEFLNFIKKMHQFDKIRNQDSFSSKFGILSKLVNGDS